MTVYELIEKVKEIKNLGYIQHMTLSKEVGGHTWIIVTKLLLEIGYRGNPPDIEAFAPSLELEVLSFEF